MTNVGPIWDIFTFRFFPFFWAGVFISISVFSEVGLNMVVVSGDVASAALYLYAVVLLGLAVFPDQTRLHVLSGPLAVMVIGGRAGGFLMLAIDRESWALTGAVLERLGILAAMIVWHRAGVVRAERGRRISVT